MKANVALGDKREINDVVWLTDEVALFQQSWRVMGTDYKVPTGALATVHAETGFVQPAGGGSVIDMLPDQPDHILVHIPENRFGLAYRLDIRTRHPRQVARSAAPFGTFVPDAAGNILITVGQSNDNRRQIHTRPAPRKRWRLVASFGLEDEKMAAGSLRTAAEYLLHAGQPGWPDGRTRGLRRRHGPAPVDRPPPHGRRDDAARRSRGSGRLRRSLRSPLPPKCPIPIRPIPSPGST